METLAELVAKISVDAAELKRGLAESEKGVQGLGKTTERETASITKALADVGKAFVVVGAAITAAMTASIMSFTKTGSELHDLSLKTGVSVTALAGLKYAAEQNGASMGTVERAIKRVASAMSDVQGDVAKANLKLAEAAATGKDVSQVMIGIQNEGGEASNAFRQLGISLTDLQGLNPEEQFLKIAGAIAEIPDPMMRSAIATKLFGLSGTDMLPMLSEGADGLRRVTEEGIKLYGVTETSAKSADALGDAFGTLKAATTGLSNTIGEFLAPILQDITEGITGVIGVITTWIDAHPALTDSLILLGGGLGLVLTNTGLLLIAIPSVVQFFSTLQTAAGALGLSVGSLTGIIALLTAGFALVGYGILELMGIQSQHQKATDLSTRLTEEYNKMLAGETNAYSKVLEESIKLIESYKVQNKQTEDWLVNAKAQLAALQAQEAEQARLNKQNQDAIAIVAELNRKEAERWAAAEKARREARAELLTELGGRPVPYDVTLMIEQAQELGRKVTEKFGYGSAAWDNFNAIMTMLSTPQTSPEAYAEMFPLARRNLGLYMTQMQGILEGWQYGGIVTQPTIGLLGEAGPEAVIPLNEMGTMGNITINFTQPVFFDREDTMNKFVDMIRKGIQRQDRLRFGGAYSG